MATKKSAPAKKKSAARKAPAKKTSSRKTAAKKTSKPARKNSGGTLHNVARSIGSTLGSFAKKTSDVVEAAKQALPRPL